MLLEFNLNKSVIKIEFVFEHSIFNDYIIIDILFSYFNNNIIVNLIVL